MKKSNVYTRTGDQGQTSLSDGTRTSKCCLRLESYGTVDELNSHIGLLISLTKNKDINQILIQVQNCLFCMGAMLSTPPDSQHISRCSITEEQVYDMEQTIDRLHEGLPVWKGFTLPGGTQAAAQAHICRVVCRRAERIICALSIEQPVDKNLMAYINRLSDMFYVLALHLNFLAGVDEILWSPQNNIKK